MRHFISHRGNLNGPNPERENHPDYIMEAIDAGFEVEVDLWVVNGELFLGHDKPEFTIYPGFLINFRGILWVHCKNVAAVEWIRERGISLNYFWHDTDTMTLTSLNNIWAYPGKQPIKDSIAVMPEWYNDDITQCSGVCSDFIQKYKE